MHDLFPAINFGMLLVIMAQMIMREYLAVRHSAGAAQDIAALQGRVQSLFDDLAAMKLRQAAKIDGIVVAEKLSREKHNAQ